MDIDKLIQAAKEIDRLRSLQKKRTAAWQQLAVDARQDKPESDIERRRVELDQVGTLNFGDAIDALCEALHAKPARRRRLT
ncbi:hypothetical protein [Geoalkalibacter halelectricus]|uniref:hypothetical protein n=1 Tax=Geoalkalibacter halelectricus TaxID=2847045 RepID=UPI0026707BBC|nr:hypothetical protein [Geoalkalibacter halelectricus]MDO3380439.1 hypothetical protein [Geoalkalibacter halelectricus]